MRTYDVRYAKVHLSRLIGEAARGEAFIITSNGRPKVKVSALDAPEASRKRRFGFMAGEIESPEDFDRMGEGQIERVFSGDE